MTQFEGYVKNALAAMAIAALFVIGALVGVPVKWLISEPKDATETHCPTCGHCAPNATEKNTTGAKA